MRTCQHYCNFHKKASKLPSIKNSGWFFSFSFFFFISDIRIHLQSFFQKPDWQKHSVNQLWKKKPFSYFFCFLGFYYPKEEPEFLNDLYQLEQEIRDKRRTEGALRFVRRNDNLFDELMLSKKLLKRDLLKRLLMNTRKQWFQNMMITCCTCKKRAFST